MDSKLTNEAAGMDAPTGTSPRHPNRSAQGLSEGKPPIFVVGVGRSGTTLLANLLGCHSLLTPIYETAYIKSLISLCECAAWYWGRSASRRASSLIFNYPQYVFAQQCQKYLAKCDEFRRIVFARSPQDEARARGIRQAYERFPFEESNLLFDPNFLVSEAERFVNVLRAKRLSEYEIYEMARLGVERVFAMHCRRAGKPRWINKTPRLLLCLDLLPKLYPGAFCIHILRDGRDVANSFKTLAWGPKNLRDAARRWKSRMEARKRADVSRLRYIEVRYEDLIQNTTDVLTRLLAFLELEGDPQTLLSQINVYGNRVGAWRDAFTLQNRRDFDHEAGDLLIELGYEKDRQWVRDRN